MSRGSGPGTGRGFSSPANGPAALADGIRCHRWVPLAPARGVVFIVHGLGEHGGRYDHVAGALSAAGFMVFAPDHRGHGLSPGRRAHIDRFSRYFAPIDELLAVARRDYPALPRFLIGHSMGGLIVARYLLDAQDAFSGAILSAPALALPVPPSPLTVWLNRLLAAVWPTLGVMQLDASAVSRDAQVVDAYEADPLVHHGRISARLVVELFDAMAEVEAGRQALRIPILALHGEADLLTAPAGSRAFVSGIASAERELRLYPGLYHEIFNEPERNVVIDDALAWLEARCLAVGAEPGE